MQFILWPGHLLTFTPSLPQKKFRYEGDYPSPIFFRARVVGGLIFGGPVLLGPKSLQRLGGISFPRAYPFFRWILRGSSSGPDVYCFHVQCVMIYATEAQLFNGNAATSR